MTTFSELHTLARGWLEERNLAHLLPDPHTHEDVRGAIAGYYPGGLEAFANVNGVRIGVIRTKVPAAPPGSAIEAPTWFNPPSLPITRTCERGGCSQEFRTRLAHKRFCSRACQKSGTAAALVLFDSQDLERPRPRPVRGNPGKKKAGSVHRPGQSVIFSSFIDSLAPDAQSSSLGGRGEV